MWYIDNMENTACSEIRQARKAQVIKVLDTLVEKHCSIRKACELAEMKEKAFRYHVTRDSELAELYARAMTALADSVALETVEIADSDTDPNKARNMITARQWLAKVLNPKKYSDRVDINVTQTIEVGNTLALARQRMLPVSDQSNTLDGANLIREPLAAYRVTDNESDAPKKLKTWQQTAGGQVPDIFD